MEWRKSYLNTLPRVGPEGAYSEPGFLGQWVGKFHEEYKDVRGLNLCSVQMNPNVHFPGLDRNMLQYSKSPT